jgi:CheY-like chemotaxis protein
MKTNSILIADDISSDIDLIKRALARARVLNPLYSVNDGDEAIAFLEGEGIYSDRTRFPYPGILLLDLKMPKVSGFAVLAWIKAHPEHQDVGVIVLTGSDDTRELAEAYQLGAISFLIKRSSMTGILSLLSDIRGIHIEREGAGVYLDFDLARPQANRQFSVHIESSDKEEGEMSSQ